MTRIGILGGGQLGRMLALAGLPLGLRFRVFDPDSAAPAGQIVEHVVAGFDDHAAVEAFARDLDVVTYEFENVPIDVVEPLQQIVPVYPPPAALRASQDRVTEKELFRRLDIATASFAAIDSRADLEGAVNRIGFPCLLKTRRFGYDGKGQYRLRDRADLATAWSDLGHVPLILEGWVPFERELSLIAIRGHAGDVAYYPLVENHHVAGILHTSCAPAPGLTPALQALAEKHVQRLLNELQYVGVLAVEFFQCGQLLIANEMAPRVHNSGHWSIEGAATSQFDNHLRAILGLPLGSTRLRSPCALVNLIGQLVDKTQLLAIDDAHLHDYGKSTRPGRKMGHITVLAPSEEQLREKVAQVLKLLPPP